jgi:hypothetical protein
MAQHALYVPQLAFIQNAFQGQRGGKAAQIVTNKEGIVVFCHGAVEANRIGPVGSHGFFQIDRQALFTGRQRMGHMFTVRAGNNYTIQPFFFRQQLAIILIKRRTKAGLFVWGRRPRISHGHTLGGHALNLLQITGMILPAPTKANDGKAYGFTCHGNLLVFSPLSLCVQCLG